MILKTGYLRRISQCSRLLMKTMITFSRPRQTLGRPGRASAHNPRMPLIVRRFSEIGGPRSPRSAGWADKLIPRLLDRAIAGHHTKALSRPPEGHCEPYGLQRDSYQGAMVRSVADAIIDQDIGARCGEKAFNHNCR